MSSTKEFIEAIRSGNNNYALNVIYKDVLPKIKKYVLKNSGTNDDVNEITQQLVEIIYRKIKHENFVPDGEIKGYMWIISRNLWINKAKHSQRMVSVEDETYLDQEDTSASNFDIKTEQNNLAYEIIKKLGDPCATFLKLRILDELKLDEIVEKMGYNNKDVVKSVGHRCKKRLIELVQNNSHLKQLLINN